MTPNASAWPTPSTHSGETATSTSSGATQIVEFLTRKWQRELDYVLRKSLWGFRENRIAVRFQYECHDAAGQWYRSYGNELWEFTRQGLMARREASINDVKIDESERRYFGPRPESEYGHRHPALVTWGGPPRSQPAGRASGGGLVIRRPEGR